MTWKIEHKYPTEKDTYEVPIDYPIAGYDTIIALWFTDLYTSIFAIMDALGYDIRGGYTDLNERLSGRLYHTRIVGDTPDFSGHDFITDGEEHFLDLSGILPKGTKAVVLNGWFLWDNPDFRIIYPVVAGADMFADGFALEDSAVAPPVIPGSRPFNVVFPVDATRKIAYQFDASIWTDESLLSVTGWFK